MATSFFQKLMNSLGDEALDLRCGHSASNVSVVC